MTVEDIKDDLVATIETTLDFGGSTVDACKQICDDYGIDYKANEDFIEQIRFETIKEYSS
jgi:hypothetical protein